MQYNSTSAVYIHSMPSIQYSTLGTSLAAFDELVDILDLLYFLELILIEGEVLWAAQLAHVLLLDPFFLLLEVETEGLFLLVGHAGLVVGVLVLVLVEGGLELVLEFVDEVEALVVLQHGLLVQADLLPLGLLLLVHLEQLKIVEHQLQPQDLVLVHLQAQLVGSHEPHVPDALRADVLVVVYVQLHQPLVAEVGHVLGRQLFALLDDHRLPALGVEAFVLPEDLVALQGVPADADVCEGEVDAVEVHVDEVLVLGAVDAGASGDGFGLVEGLLGLDLVNVGDNALQVGDPRGPSQQLHGVKLVVQYSGLESVEGRGDFADYGNYDIFELLPLHVEVEVVLVEQVLDAQVVVEVGTQHLALLLHVVHQLGDHLGVREDAGITVTLLLEVRIVEFGQQVVHVLAAREAQVLGVDKSALVVAELHQEDADLGVSDIHEDDVPHFGDGLDLLEAEVGVLGGNGLPVVHQVDVSAQVGDLSAFVDDLALVVRGVGGKADVGCERLVVVRLHDLLHARQDRHQQVLWSQLERVLFLLVEVEMQLIVQLVLAARILELLLDQRVVPLQPDQPQGCTDRVAVVALDLRDGCLPDQPLQSRVGHEGRGLSEVGLIEKHVKFLAIVGRYFEGPGSQVYAQDDGWVLLHQFKS